MSYLGRSAKLSLKAQEKVSFLATAGQTVKTGLSYTPSFVEVYVNGVLLTDTTDFTATNGNSVTFTVALLLNDEVTVISLKTFTVADHYSKTEADTLLAAKATNTALALKAPIASPSFTGNVGIGLTSGTGKLAVQGYVASGGQNYTLQLSDAINSTFRIGHQSGLVNLISDQDIGLYTSSVERMRVTDNGLTFNGDTAAANALDDYETGTWAATDVSGAGLTFSTNGGYYIKVGDMVHVNIYFNFPATSNGSNALVAGLPFTAGSNNNYSYLVGRSASGGISCQINQGGTNFEIRLSTSDALKANSNLSSSHILVSGTYKAA